MTRLAHYGRAIAIKPDYAEAHFNRAEIKTFHRGDADLAALEALAGRDDLSANNARISISPRLKPSKTVEITAGPLNICAKAMR